MKQHITEQQLQELSDKAARKLRNWLTDHKPQFIPGDVMWKGWLLTRLSIGEMIEFLDEHYRNQIIKYRSALLIDNQSINTRDGGRWLVMKASNHKDRKYFSDEPCDALWSAVREILEIASCSSLHICTVPNVAVVYCPQS